MMSKKYRSLVNGIHRYIDIIRLCFSSRSLYSTQTTTTDILLHGFVSSLASSAFGDRNIWLRNPMKCRRGKGRSGSNFISLYPILPPFLPLFLFCSSFFPSSPSFLFAPPLPLNPGTGASICGEDWPAQTPFRPSFSPPSSPPLPLEVGPLKCSRGVRGSAVSSTSGGVLL